MLGMPEQGLTVAVAVGVAVVVVVGVGVSFLQPITHPEAEITRIAISGRITAPW